MGLAELDTRTLDLVVRELANRDRPDATTAAAIAELLDQAGRIAILPLPAPQLRRGERTGLRLRRLVRRLLRRSVPLERWGPMPPAPRDSEVLGRIAELLSTSPQWTGATLAEIELLVRAAGRQVQLPAADAADAAPHAA